MSTDYEIIIVGGGPAGMKSAEIAARRGHFVTLYEKKNELGGQFLFAAIPPCKQVLNDFSRYLIGEIKKLPVRIHLGKTFQETDLVNDKPDVLIVATGASPCSPSIDGVERAKVFTSPEALSRPDRLGNVVGIIGGGGIGAEIADFLSEQGKKVTLIEMREAIATCLKAGTLPQ